MTGIYILKDEKLVPMIKQYFNGEIPRTAELYQDLPNDALELMRARSKQLQHPYKITLSIFNGSTIMNQVEVLENYSMDIEVLVPLFVREYNMWSQKQETRGSLEGKYQL